MRGRGENSRVDLSGTCRSMVHASAPLDWWSLLVLSGLAPAARRVFSIRVEMLKKKKKYTIPVIRPTNANNEK